MEIKALFTGPEENKEALEKIVSSFKHGAGMCVGDAFYKILDVHEGLIIVGIKAQLNVDMHTNGDEDGLREALMRRLMALAIARGFIPVDNEGRQIWLFPHYGFEVFFHTPHKNQANLLFEAAKLVCDELGPHMEDAHVGELGEVEMGGEVFSVQIYMQDYLAPDEREKLMLAAYLRLLLLARKAGFTAITPGGKHA